MGPQAAFLPRRMVSCFPLVVRVDVATCLSVFARSLPEKRASTNAAVITNGNSSIRNGTSNIIEVILVNEPIVLILLFDILSPGQILAGNWTLHLYAARKSHVSSGLLTDLVNNARALYVSMD